jgi:hypothetical protein
VSANIQILLKKEKSIFSFFGMSKILITKAFLLSGGLRVATLPYFVTEED